MASVLAAAALAITAGCGDADGSATTLALDDVAHGVSPMVIDQTRLFVVREGDEVWTIVPLSHGQVGTTVGWCPSKQVFYDDTPGSVFDVDGVKLSGPAPRGLDRYPTVVRGTEVVIDVRSKITGPGIETTSSRHAQGAQLETRSCAGAGLIHPPPVDR